MYHLIIVVGDLGKDPEMRFTPSGQPVTSFNVATNRVHTGADGNQVKETLWFRVSVWGKQAEACKNFLAKGRRVLVEGRLEGDPATGGPKVWSRADGSAGAAFDVTASTVRFLDKKGDPTGESYAGEPAPADAAAAAAAPRNGGFGAPSRPAAPQKPSGGTPF